MPLIPTTQEVLRVVVRLRRYAPHNVKDHYDAFLASWLARYFDNVTQETLKAEDFPHSADEPGNSIAYLCQVIRAAAVSDCPCLCFHAAQTAFAALDYLNELVPDQDFHEAEVLHAWMFSTLFECQTAGGCTCDAWRTN